MSSEVIRIQRRSDGSFVQAELFDGMVPNDFIFVGNEWASERSVVMQELLQSGLPRQQWPQSLHWNWGRKLPSWDFLKPAASASSASSSGRASC